LSSCLLLLLPAGATLISVQASAQTNSGGKPSVLRPGAAERLKAMPPTQAVPNVAPPGITPGMRASPPLLKKLSDPKWLAKFRTYGAGKRTQTIPLSQRERDAMDLRPWRLACAPGQTPQAAAQTEQRWRQVEQGHYQRCLESYTRGAGDIPSAAQDNTCRAAAQRRTAQERRNAEKKAGDGDGDGVLSWCIGGLDCDDQHPNRWAGNAEISDAMHLDEDCDPATIGNEDRDGDGYISARSCNVSQKGSLVCGTDCDDNNRNIHPNQADPINGIDENCDTIPE
jgi:hypothetical protein